MKNYSVELYLLDLAQKSIRDNPPEACDYYGEDGLFICGRCHTPRQIKVKAPLEHIEFTATVPCSCRQKDIDELEVQKKALRLQEKRKALLKSGITDIGYLEFCFANDDRRLAGLSDYCRKYAERFDKVRAENAGILFYGGVGTGKTFLACCIANMLIERGIPAVVTNFPKVLNKLQDYGDENRLRSLDKMLDCELLVIDDLGVEWNTPFALAQTFNMIDTRIRSKKPIIVTTNLNPGTDMTTNLALDQKRIFDRLRDVCVPIKVDGKSRRIEAGKNRAQLLKVMFDCGNDETHQHQLSKKTQ